MNDVTNLTKLDCLVTWKRTQQRSKMAADRRKKRNVLSTELLGRKAFVTMRLIDTIRPAAPVVNTNVQSSRLTFVHFISVVENYLYFVVMTFVHLYVLCQRLVV